ncbi:MAG TPA: hypothetical protein PLD14_02720 [Candidatus Pacearchaeota archaeon]|nr:hypothetical protein [Candidatus Pacearchaeota archaeon]HPR80114.1 hypothetical protein [Candidatus Pacearchaeota archaeon]
MENLQQRIIKGVNIFKNKNLLFITICLISSIISIFAIPLFIKGSFSEQEINEGIKQVGATYGGALTFSASEMIASMILMFQLSIISTLLVIVAYIVKQMIDKKMFRMNKWRDWRFFLYISAISLIIVDFFQKIIFAIGNDFITNLMLTIISCFITVIFSSIILPEEIPEIKMQ